MKKMILLLVSFVLSFSCVSSKNTSFSSFDSSLNGGGNSSISSSEASNDSSFSSSSTTSSTSNTSLVNSNGSSINSESSSSISSSSFSSPISESSSSTSESSSSTTSSSSFSEDVLLSLSEPILTLDDETGVVSWEKVEGATHYNYIINDGEVHTITTTTVTLKDKENISVQASSDYACSHFSKAITYYDTSDVNISTLKEVKVYFHDSNLDSINVKTGQSISRPSTPTKLNHQFDDWYKDPFYKEKFDFSAPITEKTVVYAKWIPNDLIKDTYFWAKVSPKISSSITSEVSNPTVDWKFVPLKVNTAQTEFKEFYCTVTVSGATSENPAFFIFMDGFDDALGRTYWKNNGADFTITSDGTYNLYFSAEHEYTQGVNGLAYQISNTGISYLQRQNQVEVIKTPVVEVDNVSNIARWGLDENATSYEVIINNGTPQIVTENQIQLDKGQHISVRAIYQNDCKSNWSIPKANINYISGGSDKDKYAFVYFAESGESSIKVEKNSTVNEIALEDENNRTFEGWYLEPGCKNKVTFPYTVTDNVTFYPKWNYATEYYQLVTGSGTVVGKFVLNEDNFDYYEYELKEKVLEATNYYVKSLDGKTTYQQFNIGKKGTYSIYFSEDKLWTDQETPRHVYIRHDKYDIYFTNALHWTGDIYAYYWNATSNDKKAEWPGVKMEYVRTNSQGQKIYKCQIDLVQYEHVIFTNGSLQTVDISLVGVSNNQAYYTTDAKDGSGKYKYGTWMFTA